MSGPEFSPIVGAEHYRGWWRPAMIARYCALTFLISITIGLISSDIRAQDEQPSFLQPGDLEPGSGEGYKKDTIYFPGIRFPIEQPPAFANSQVYRPGGQSGPGGTQCDTRNYSYPWRDNYCETRGWGMPLCPKGKGHQGQDIRPATCKKDTYWAVAVDDGLIAHIGSYSVTLQTARGTLYRYLHLNMDNLAVEQMDKVKKGDKIGLVSNWFGNTRTSIHLHFDIKDTVVVEGRKSATFMPLYASLIDAYKRLLKNAE